ncbi:MAG: aldehyde dehydrogenase family protein [Acidobacteriota bacterium]
MMDVTATANDYLEKAALAAAEFQELDQEQTDRIVEAAYKAGFGQRVRLAKMAHEETGLGVWQHKVVKNALATQLVYENIRRVKTVGVLSDDEMTGITEIAQALGPVFAVTPVTNPTSTVMFKILICLKTRNPIIVSPHRRSRKCSVEAARVCYEAALKVDAPENCIQVITEGSRELTHAIMSHRRLALILATGGTGLVHEAYSSGTPALGVGPGNVPVFIDRSADIPFAVQCICASKTFDNGTICASEQAVVVEKAIADAVIREFERQHAYFLTNEEIPKVEKIAIDSSTGGMSPEVVGQSVEAIARMAGISLPACTKLLLARLNHVGKDAPLSGEVLAPILAFYVCEDYDHAIKTCIELNYLGGIGHSASIYANDEETIRSFAEVMNAGRVLVNTPSSQGAVGSIFNTLAVSLTLGCGSGGKNITTENVTARHLINIKRICRRRLNARWLALGMDKILDESLGADEVWRLYNRNQ